MFVSLPFWPAGQSVGLLATAPRLRALHRAEHTGRALKRGVKVCQRQLVNEVLGPLVTEFVRNFGREDATPIQLGPNASLFGRVQAVKLIRHSALPRRLEPPTLGRLRRFAAVVAPRPLGPAHTTSR